MSDKDHRGKAWPWLLAIAGVAAVSVPVAFIAKSAAIIVATVIGTGIIVGAVTLIVLNQKTK